MDLDRVLDRLRPGHGKPVAHFLHLGKTGGTAVKEALRPQRHKGTYRIVPEPHAVHLDHLPPEDLFFFFVRHPVSRFASAFVSRQRQGAPRYHYPWNRREEAAFTRFSTAEALAEALSSPDAEERAAAQDAMGGIQHVRDSYWTWFGDETLLRSRADRLLHVGAQETLEADFPVLLDRLGLAGRGITLPTDEVKAHRNPASARAPMSPTAVANLTRWYARDFEFIGLCAELFPAFDATACLGTDSRP